MHNRCKHPIEMAYRCAHCDEVLELAEIEYRTDAASKQRSTSRNKALAVRGQ